MFNRNAFNDYQHMNLICKNAVGAQLWLGDYYAATEPDLLSKKNIQAVLTAAAHLDIAYPHQLLIEHKTINAYDIPTYKMTKHFEEAFQFINKCLESGKNVLVHCAAGISRSTTCVIVYLMRKRDFNFKQALSFIRKRRPIVNPNYGFEGQLQKYEDTLRKRNRNKLEKEKNAVRSFLSEKKETDEKKLSKTFELNNFKLTKTFQKKEPYKMPLINEKLYSTAKETQSIKVPKIVTIKR